jgi:release factor glutamine methyltransferase
MTTMEVWTIRRLLEWTTQYFASKGFEAARLEAEILLAHSLGCQRTQLYVQLDLEPTEAQRTAFRSLVKKRAERCPVAYLVGKRDFYLLTFEVTPAVLIPRPETEQLVLEALAILKPLTAPRVLDIGTGSGCIAISLAHQQPKADVTAIDISADALAVAQRNAEKHQVASRMRFLQGNLMAPLDANERFDLIVSNPPYIAESEYAELDADVRDFEPKLALVSGQNGLEVYQQLIPAAKRFLKPGGALLLEIGYQQDQTVAELLTQSGFQSVKLFRDFQRHPRVLLGRVGN